jgi:hypothetical protein
MGGNFVKDVVNVVKTDVEPMYFAWPADYVPV